MTVRLGIDVLKDRGFAPLRGKRIGLLSNPSGVDRDMRATWENLWEAPAVNLVALFGPEHGFSATAPNAEPVAPGVDRRSELPIHSLFDPEHGPDPEILSGLDAVVCDLQDVGARFYTYTWSVSQLLEVAGRVGVEVVILDRPNPLGGEVVAGPLLDPALASFIGRYPIPLQHGMTIGELATMMNERWNPAPARLTIIPCDGWQRSMTWDATGLSWVPPSPAIPHLSAVRHYPGACLLEGTNVSEGRGTALPFEVAGAPWIDGRELAERLNAARLPGVQFRPHTFQPATSKYAGDRCHGVQVHIYDVNVFRPIEIWLGVIREIRLLYPDRFEWIPPGTPELVTSDFHHFDHLIGNGVVRQQIDAGLPLAEIVVGWDEMAAEFRAARQPYLRYG